MIQNVIWGVLLFGNFILLILVFNRLGFIVKHLKQHGGQNVLDALRDEVSRSDGNIKDEIRSNRQTIENMLTNQFQSTSKTLVDAVGKLGAAQTRELRGVTAAINNLTQTNESKIKDVRDTVDKSLQAMQTSNENKLEQMR